MTTKESPNTSQSLLGRMLILSLKGNLSTSKFRDQKKRQIKLKCLLKEVEAKGVKSNYFVQDLFKIIY
jgi:hypothetical protein